MQRVRIKYQEFPPPPGLAGLVDCLWLAEAPAAATQGVAHRVLPDNCTDILFQDTGQAPFFVGMMSTWRDIPGGAAVRTAAVRFRPGAAGLFLGSLPLSELLDGRADLHQLWGRADTERLNDALWSVARSDGERLALLHDALLARLARASGGARAGAAMAARLGGTPGWQLARQAVAALEASGGALRVEQLAAQLGVSRQYLGGQFLAHVGLSPKLFARICRFRQARDAALGAPVQDWAALAAGAGYYDQSHLIRDFQDFAGAAPASHCAARP